ncbi:hypothetical protein GYMLUDRAFT_244065 [Collybiopsis luxurians FD-317 M1]|uniref:Uncharacterized protein n=1 Tax=Collybiopsis luxurians FD-317 M1 TaxID=944289 RepID=A0A0D0CXF9_9AGAR|nr:hypothetical protein GYMLUDRAFT_244065 [Collybiopsis luxurians FD-317 M1]
MQRIPVNHQAGSDNLLTSLRKHTDILNPGHTENTLLHSFHKGAAFCQWLLNRDRTGSNIMKTCRKLVDKAFNFTLISSDDEDSDRHNPADSEEAFHSSYHPPSQVPRELSRLLDNSVGDISLLSRILAPSGFHFYAIPGAPGKGNSFICFRIGSDSRSEWAAGQIQYIFKQAGSVKLAVRRSLALPLVDASMDPFKSFWPEGFEAKMVSTDFSDELDVLDLEGVIAHTARWQMTPEITLVLKAHQVMMYHPSGFRWHSYYVYRINHIVVQTYDSC